MWRSTVTSATVVLQRTQRLRVAIREVTHVAHPVVLVTSSELLELLPSQWRKDYDEILICEEWSAPAIWQLTGLRPESGVRYITNDEYCSDLMAELNAISSQDQGPNLYRDKVDMKRRLGSVVSVPVFMPFDPSVYRVAKDIYVGRCVAHLRLPLVAKPRKESNSRGVAILQSLDEVRGWMDANSGEADYELESYLTGTMFHVNAAVADGYIECLMVGEYLNPPYEFQCGRPIGGISLPRSDPRWRILCDTNEDVVRALGSEGFFVTHSEFFMAETGEIVFLEAAARAPGALVSELARTHVGIQLEALHLDLQLRPASIASSSPVAYGAWVWIPQAVGASDGRWPALESRSCVSWAPRSGSGPCLLESLESSRERPPSSPDEAFLWAEDPDIVRSDFEQIRRSVSC
jgi:biotin carboxylase